MTTKKTEYRSTTNELASQDGMKVSGYAAVFDSYARIPAKDYDFEVIDQHAFDDADFSRCVLRYNHSDHDQLLARTSNNTLKLSIDKHGLHVDAELANTTQGRDVYELVKRQDVRSMSFGFQVAEDYIQNRVRHITKIATVLDVSAVDDPAYPATSLEVVQRSIMATQKAAEKHDVLVKRLAIAQQTF